MTPIQWISKLLQRHSLNRTDGRPLYQYRITDSEYSELESTLKLSAMMGIQNIIKMMAWDAAFVIYAAEWWRRSYSGNWGWDGIFKSLRLDYSELSTVKHHNLIETGLQRWKRTVRFHNGSRKFLGTIATEGGLPLYQLSDSGGWLGNILRPVIKLHISRGISVSVLIESHISDIPQSYQSTEMEQILSDITETIISLRKEHHLMDKSSPLEHLDNNQPQWRELFPLPVDDAAAKSLLGDLVNAASKTIKKSNSKSPFEVDRFLLHADTDFPKLVAQIEMPTYVNFSSLKKDSLVNNFPATFEIEIYNPSGKSWLWCRGIKTTHKGESKLKLSGNTFKLKDVDASTELRIRFKSMGEIVHELELLGGQFLDKELPWLFKSVENKWRLHGVASQSAKDDEVIVYIPSISTFQTCNGDAQLYKYGSLESGTIYKLKGEINCFIEELKYKLSSGKEESILQYHLTGKSLPFTSVPNEVFIGIPELVETNLVTSSSRIIRTHNNLMAKPLGSGQHWTQISQVSTGCYEIKLIDDEGHIQIRKQVGILNSDFSLKLKHDKDVSKGNVHVSGVSHCQINICDENIITNTEQEKNLTNISLYAKETPPISFDLSLLAQGHKKDILLSLPFPSKGALLFDPEDKNIPFSSKLYLDELAGYRIKIFSNKFNRTSKINLHFALNDVDIKHANARDIYINHRLVLSNDITEFSVFDWLNIIKSLLTVSTSLDSFVVISMLMDGVDIFKLTIQRFENEITAIWDEGIIELDTSILNQFSIENLEKIAISSLFLKQPEQSDDKLLALKSEGIYTGKWSFSPETRALGPWLIYPHIDSTLYFRPLLWNNGTTFNNEETEDIEGINTLHKAIGIFDQHLRNKAIHQVLKLMASNLEHRSWQYIENLWEKCEHLPMSTFDIWKLAINQPKFLACLLINGYDQIVNRLVDELPLIWELVKYSDWEQSIFLYKKKLLSHLDEDDEDFLNQLITKKINIIESLSESMISHGKILKKDFFAQTSQDLLVMKGPAQIILKPIIDDEIQNLLRRQAESIWPNPLNNFILQECKVLPNEYRSLLSSPNSFQQSVILLPMLLAWRSLSNEVYEEWPCNAGEMFKLQQIINFDKDWFVVIYKLLTAWLSQQNFMVNN